MIPENNIITTEKAWLFHKIGVDRLGFSDDTGPGVSLCVTVHDIKKSAKGPVLGAGRLMSETDKLEVRDVMNGENTMGSEWIPPNLLMINRERMVWYVSSSKRPMFFLQGDMKVSLEIHWPSLVFCYDHVNKFRVAAYAGMGRPAPSQKLFHAPIFNVYDNSQLCSGSADTTDVISIDSMMVWEDAIFHTNFTHSNHSRVIASKSGHEIRDKDYIRFIKGKSRTGKRIMAKEMTPLNLCLEQWVSSS